MCPAAWVDADDRTQIYRFMRPADAGRVTVSVVLPDSALLVPVPRPVAIWISWWSWSGRFQWAHLDQWFGDSGERVLLNH